MPTSDAIAREVAWLNSFGDGLPALADPNGPWGIIQSYEPRVAAKRKSGVYVSRPEFTIRRFANVRTIANYKFKLKLIWPLTSGAGSAESDQQAFDIAIDLLLQRIMGQPAINSNVPLDKTHGGRFLSVAENPDYITVNQLDPDMTIQSSAGFLAEIFYSADDNEIIN